MEASISKLGNYRLLARIGQGGMGIVYRAEDVRLGRHVALKVLPRDRIDEELANQRFLEEARAVAALDHPHICTLFEYGEDQGQAYIAMQLVEGETLREALRQGPLAEERARRILGAIASALAAAHGIGIVHRDVKSENVLLGRSNEIKLADFGIARLAGGRGLTSTATLLGTPAYLAPEVLRGEPAGPASDQFSLAVVAYECVTGALPFTERDPAALLYSILNVFPDPPSRRHPGLGGAWNAVVMRGLAKDPAQRYPSIAEFGSAVHSTAALEAKAQAIEPGSASPSAAAPLADHSRPATAARSLAVLFFENASGDPEHDYFCDGIAEDLLADLSQVPGLRLASWNAVQRYKNSTSDVRQVMAELGVEAAVKGRVRKIGDRIRINAQLVDAHTDFQLWADRYDRTLDDVFEVQEEIAHAIASALGRAPSETARVAMRRARPQQVEAYDSYLKGRELYRRYSREDMQRALAHFEQAVVVEPDYALAWAGIADCCGQMLDRGWDQDPRWRERGLEAARRAVMLDPGRPEGHKAEALFHQVDRATEPAIAALKRALECDPSFTPALINLAQECLHLGDFAGAERALRRASAVDPAYGLTQLLLALVFLYTRRWNEAIAACHRAQNVGASPFHSAYAYAMRSQAYLGAGDLAAARQEIQGGRAASLSPNLLAAAHALVEAHAGASELARALLSPLAQSPPKEAYGSELAAAAAGVLGEAALTTRFLEAAEAVDKRHPPAWRIHPDLRRIREAPEFRDWIGQRGRSVVWPLEAPALDPEDRAQLEEFREASGLAEPAGATG